MTALSYRSGAPSPNFPIKYLPSSPWLGAFVDLLARLAVEGFEKRGSR